MTEGIVKLYILGNTAENGSMPKEELIEIAEEYYSEQRIGVTRLYAALGANQRIDALIRIYGVTEMPERTDGSGRKMTAEYAIPEDGKQYRISAVQKVIGEDAFDLTLERLEKYYDVTAGKAEEG